MIGIAKNVRAAPGFSRAVRSDGRSGAEYLFASRYDETQSYTTLRGIYFSSSHQPVDFSLLNNQTIVRKWSNYVDNQNPATTASVVEQPAERDFLVSDVSYGRQYFLKQLFSDVIVKDLDLARYNLANESKYRLQRFLGHTVAILAAVFLLNGFHNSYLNNSRYLHVVDNKAATLGDEVNRFSKTTNEGLIPQLLTLSQYLPEYGTLNVYSPGLNWRYGLYTGKDVVNASESLYQYFLERLLLPQIERQVTLALQQAIDTDNPEQIYSYLKLYLMVYGQGKFDSAYIVDSVTRLWEETGKLQPYEERQILISHLNTLLQSPTWRRFGQPADAGLVKYARALLDRDDLASRLYRRIKDAAAADAPADLTLSAMTRSRGGELFSLGEDSEATSIPGLFTRAGYHSLFKKMDLGLMGLEREDGWVMGKEKDNPLPKVGVARNGALINPVQKQILALYLDEYTQRWQAFLRNIRIKTDVLPLDSGSAGMASDIYILRTLAAPDSPLANLVQRAVAETTLSEPEGKSLLDNVSNKGQILNAAMKVSLAYAALEKSCFGSGLIATSRRCASLLPVLPKS
ncbi:ImcF-related family protein [Apirhabdus apintestini]|nr:ImcF-related family protein [Enterobacteriaceae bacterium CA-0114]